MDMVTHAMMGLALAAPFLPTAPSTACCFIVGSVLPDLDAFSRTFGKRAFLRCHQTVSHSLLIIAPLGLTLSYPLWRVTGEAWAALALARGMALRALLDATNTFGTALLAPFSTRRFCTEWVFFIDAAVISLTICALVLESVAPTSAIPIAFGYALALPTYWAVRALARKRAMMSAPVGTFSLVPDAWLPWSYFGCASIDDRIQTFLLSLLSGPSSFERHEFVSAPTHLALLDTLEEYRTMRSLSSGYRLVAATSDLAGTLLVCRDLRVRNFGGDFGELKVLVNQQDEVVWRRFNV